MIEATPGFVGGRPRIAGTRTSVQCIAIENLMGNSAEEIVADRPHLTLAQVHAALAYYWANKAEIDADIAADEAAEEEYLRTHPVRG